MDELNKKLAEWAGLRFYDPCIVFDAEQNSYDAPNFTQSLDACFKWLVPKLWEEEEDSGCGVQIFLRQCSGRGWTTNGWMGSLMAGERIANIEGAETPTLALCKAIEKLIDGG